MTIRDTGVRLVIDNLNSFVSGMKRYNTSVQDAEKATVKFSEQAGKAGRALALLGAPIVAFGAVSVKAAVDFDSAMVGVAKTTGATAEEIEALGREFRALAKEIPVSASALANIGEVAGRLGVETTDIRAFTETVAALGVAADGLPTEQAAEFLARIQAITQLPADEVENFSSALIALGNDLATNEGAIAQFTLRLAGVGSVAGLAQAEMLGIAGSFSALGIEAQRGGTAVQKVLFAMIQAINAGGPELDIFASTAGITAGEFATLFEQDAAGAFTNFVEGLERAGDNAITVLQDLGLQDARLAQAFVTVSQAGSALRDNIALSTSAFAENTALVTEAEARYASAASQFKIFLNNVTDLAIAVGDILLPPLLLIIDVVTPIIEKVAEFAKENPNLTKTVVALGLVLVAAGAALVLIGLAAPAAVAGFALVSAAVSATVIPFLALAVAMGPITLIVLGIGAAIALGIIIWKNWGNNIETITGIVETFVDFLKEAFNLIKNLNPLVAGLNLLEAVTPIDIPGLAHGGNITRGGMAIVGERGPEVVNLPTGASVTPNVTNTTNFSVTANYPNRQDPATITQDLQTMRMMAGR